MNNCPYCHSSDTRYSRIFALHLVRLLTGSEKRYCLPCDKKWRVRARRKTVNTSFYVVALPLAAVFMLGMFKLTDQSHQQALNYNSAERNAASAAMGVQKMSSGGLGSSLGMAAMIAGAGNPGAKNQKSALLSGLSGSNRRLAEKAMKNMSMDEISDKMKKLQSNPQALARLSGEKREVVEQALKYMKAQKGR